MKLVYMVGYNEYMYKAANNNTGLKKMAVKGSIWFSLIWALIAIIPYHAYVVILGNTEIVYNEMGNDMLFTMSVNFFRYILCFMGAVVARLFMRKVGTELPVWKSKSLSGALKNLFASSKTVHTVIPFIVFIVMQIVICAPSNTLVNWYTIPLYLVYLYVDSYVEELSFRGILAELMIIKRRETSEGVMTSVLISGLFSGIYTCISLVVIWGIPQHYLLFFTVVAFNCLLSLFYYRTRNIYVTSICRFLMKAVILTPVIVFGSQVMFAPDEWYLVIFFVYFVLSLAPYLMDNDFEILKNIVRNQTDYVVKFYARYGIETGKKSLRNGSQYQKHLNKRVGRSNLTTKELTAKYIKLAIGFGLVLAGVCIALQVYFRIPDWQLLLDEGVEFVAIQISSTFLILSFLSFLTSRDDYILWLDTMSHKFIFPKYFNFVDTSVYAFTAMLFALAAHMLREEYVMLLFFAIGISILIEMTFKMINVFFNRNGLLLEIEQLYYDKRTDGDNEFDIDKKNKYLSDLYQNSVHVIEQNDCRKIRENFSFLARLYSVYKRQSICAKNATIRDEETGKKAIRLSTVPAEYDNMKLQFFLKHEDGDGYNLNFSGMFSEDEESTPSGVDALFTASEEDLHKLVARLEREITYFAIMLLKVNPVLMIQMLDEYNSRLLEIDSLREVIIAYILGEIAENDVAFAVPEFFDDVMFSYIWALKSAREELTFLDSDDEEYEPDSSFILEIHKCYESIRINYPEQYNGVCLKMLEELNSCYEMAKSLAEELKVAETSDNSAVSEAYGEWISYFTRQYDKFKEAYTENVKNLSKQTQ